MDELGAELARLGDTRTVATVAALLCLLGLAWVAGVVQKQRRMRRTLALVNDATFGRCLPRSRAGVWGFVVGVTPPPEPFREFNISYQPLSILDPRDLLRWLRGGRAQLQIAGLLHEAPVAELVWARRQLPLRVVGVTPGPAPWVHHQLYLGATEYATRGPNVGALQHEMRDLYARFTPGLTVVQVQRGRVPEVRLVYEGVVDARTVAPLLAAARSLGRGALLA
jgi:hypothetical protein